METLASQDKPAISVAVRDLAEAVRRYGNISGPFYSGVTGLEGTQAHQRFFEQAGRYYRDHQLSTEVALKGSYVRETLPFDLVVQGRCDLVAVSPDDQVILVEVKTFRGKAASIPREGDPAHLAQALLYGYLLFDSDFFQNRENSGLQIELRYLSIDDGDSFSIRQAWTRQGLEEEYNQICDDYTGLIKPHFLHRQARNQANRQAAFPYQELRDGQKSMMQEVIAAVRDKTVLFVQAPTGIGKTMATLYPAVKAQANGLTDVIFYLTPTRSQRQVAEDTVDDLEAEGFLIRSLTLRAKEQICLSKEHFCDTRICPYAIRYHDHLRQALIKSYETRRLSADAVLSLGREFELCPFELSLSLLPTVDLVICDYNYVFNPRVRLHGWLDQPGQSYTLLVDEAHNLARRSREMFSSVLSRSALETMRQVMAGHLAQDAEQRKLNQRICASLSSLIAWLDRYRALLAGQDPAAKEGLKNELASLQAVFGQHFLATRLIPPRLLDQVAAITGPLTRYLNDYPDFQGRRQLMIAYFDLMFFSRVAERYYSDSYITSWRPVGEQDLDITLLALDASAHLTDIYRDRSPVVFFSATLSPLPYYQTLLDARSAVEKPEVICLPSPFPKERRLVVCYQAHSIRYADRAGSVDQIASLIQETVLLRKGHYLVFSPSFAYQRQLVRALTAIREEEIDYLIQPSKMTEAQKEKFLAYFRRGKGDKSLVGLTVLGSLFNEGVDLTGEELIGVMVIGTGLPGLSPERDILRQYYDAQSGSGFEYAYMWPGFNRVTQAAGRLIRSQDDYGVILLIDDRYGRSDYRQLIPQEWNAMHLDDREECLDVIRSFWADFD